MPSKHCCVCFSRTSTGNVQQWKNYCKVDAVRFAKNVCIVDILCLKMQKEALYEIQNWGWISQSFPPPCHLSIRYVPLFKGYGIHLRQPLCYFFSIQNASTGTILLTIQNPTKCSIVVLELIAMANFEALLGPQQCSRGHDFNN